MAQFRTFTKIPGVIDGKDVFFDDWQETVEMIRIGSMLPDNDPNWYTVDSNGHSHQPEVYTDQGNVVRVKGYPSLDVIRTNSEWCDMCNEAHVLFSHYECVVCRERVNPGQRQSLPTTIPGMTSITCRITTDDPELYSGHQREFSIKAGAKHYLAYRTVTTINSIGGRTYASVEFSIIKEIPNV